MNGNRKRRLEKLANVFEGRSENLASVQAISDETVRRLRYESPQAVGLLEDIILRNTGHDAPTLADLQLVSDAELWAVERFEEVYEAVASEMGVAAHGQM